MRTPRINRGVLEDLDRNRDVNRTPWRSPHSFTRTSIGIHGLQTGGFTVLIVYSTPLLGGATRIFGSTVGSAGTTRIE
jgi:hypothetical protein